MLTRHAAETDRTDGEEPSPVGPCEVVERCRIVGELGSDPGNIAVLLT
jgi:hypothetical protein